MSKPVIDKPEKPIDREQSINDLIESVALIEVGLAHIINAEGEKIQKVVKHDQDKDVPIEEILKVNDSVGRMISAISRLEVILQGKLDTLKDLEINKD